MKKIIALALALVLLILPSVTMAGEGFDVKKYSYSELQVIYRMIRFEMMRRPEWQRVEIPVGIWIVGEDIPAGAYSIRITPDGAANVLLWRSEKDDYTDNGLIVHELLIYGKTEQIGKVYFEDGNVLEISGSPVYLCPPVGLGF